MPWAVSSSADHAMICNSKHSTDYRTCYYLAYISILIIKFPPPMFCLDRNYCRGSFIWHISQLHWMQSKNPFFIISSRSAIPKVSSIKSPFCTSEPATIAVQKSQVLIPGIPPASNGIPPNFQERNVGKLDQTFHGNSLTFSSQGHSSPPPNPDHILQPFNTRTWS